MDITVSFEVNETVANEKKNKKQGDIDALPIFKSRLKIMLLHLTVFSFHFSFYFY